MINKLWICFVILICFCIEVFEMVFDISVYGYSYYIEWFKVWISNDILKSLFSYL